jgi:hypothetical protein
MRVMLLYASHMTKIAALYDAPDAPSAETRRLVLAPVAAGFSSLADDHLNRDHDRRKLLIQRPAATHDLASPWTPCRGRAERW